jgi:hypothetical protein
VKNDFYAILFLVVMIVAPTLLRLIGIPSFDVVLSSVFGDNKIMAVTFSIALVVLIIFVVYKSIQKHIVQ